MFGHVRSMRRAVVGVLVAAIIGAFGSVTAGASLVQASQKPEHGGTVVIGGYTQATIDPDNPAWTQGGLALGVNIFGALFSPVATSGGNPSGVAPDLASAPYTRLSMRWLASDIFASTSQQLSNVIGRRS